MVGETVEEVMVEEVMEVEGMPVEEAMIAELVQVVEEAMGEVMGWRPWGRCWGR